MIDGDVKVLPIERNLPGCAAQLTGTLDANRRYGWNLDDLRVFACDRFLTRRSIVGGRRLSGANRVIQRLDDRFRITRNLALWLFRFHRSQHLVLA